METIKFDDIKQVLSNYNVYNLKNEKLDISEKSEIFYKNNYTQNIIELSSKKENKAEIKTEKSSLSASASNEQEKSRGFRR